MADNRYWVVVMKMDLQWGYQCIAGFDVPSGSKGFVIGLRTYYFKETAWQFHLVLVLVIEYRSQVDWYNPRYFSLMQMLHLKPIYVAGWQSNKTHFRYANLWREVTHLTTLWLYTMISTHAQRLGHPQSNPAYSIPHYICIHVHNRFWYMHTSSEHLNLMSMCTT